MLIDALLTRILYLSIVFLVSCGLPTSVSVNINNLNRPSIQAYNKNDTLYIEITGYYPANEYPDFIGYNIYVGDNNEPSKIIHRVMFISSGDDLPSYEVSLVLATNKVTIPLEEINFRYSKYAKDENIPDNVSKDVLLTKPLMDYEKYYFIAEAVENNRNGLRSDPVKLIFVNFKTNINWKYSNTLEKSIDAFSDLKVIKDFFQINYSSAKYDYTITSGGAVESIYQSIPTEDVIYSEDLYKPYLHHIYYFRAISKSDSSVKQYFSVWVEKVGSKELTISYGHMREELADLSGELKNN